MEGCKISGRTCSTVSTGGFGSSGSKKMVSCIRRRKFSRSVVGLLIMKVFIEALIIPNLELLLLFKP